VVCSLDIGNIGFACFFAFGFALLLFLLALCFSTLE